MPFLTAVILAAGKGTRMVSNLPKVLHTVNGLPMLSLVLRAAKAAEAQQALLVVGHGASMIQEAYPDLPTCLQEPQLGTGHALQVAIPALPADTEDILVLCGDTPLISAATLQELYRHFLQTGAAATVLAALQEDPHGYGRLLRDASGNLLRIVEEKDASAAEKSIREVNTGVYCFKLAEIKQLIYRLKPNNAQKEYYLTDLIAALSQQGKTVNCFVAPDPREFIGVNDRVQLAEAAALLRQRKNRALALAGVTIVDPANTYIEEDCQVAPDSVIEPFCFLRGSTVIGQNCLIGEGCDLTDSKVGDGCVLKKSVLWESTVGQNCQIGPFTYLRPGACLADNVKVGDFVEIKKSQIGTGSKVPHLSYIGDAKVGEKVNIGCGTITCNYDGYHKYLTVIGDGAFIGSNTNLVAPVTVGENALVAAGSTITTDVPPEALGIARGRQSNIEGWNQKRRVKNEAEKTK